MDTEQKLLAEDNIRLVYYLFKQFGKSEFIQQNEDDIIAEGMVGLVKAAKHFDAGKGNKFATFAARCITNEMLMFLRRCRKWKAEISLFTPLNIDADGNELQLIDILDDGGKGEEACESVLIEAELAEFLANQKEGRRQMVELRADGQTQRQIAENLGYSQSYVSRVINGIKRQFRARIAE